MTRLGLDHSAGSSGSTGETEGECTEHKESKGRVQDATDSSLPRLVMGSYQKGPFSDLVFPEADRKQRQPRWILVFNIIINSQRPGLDWEN